MTKLAFSSQPGEVGSDAEIRTVSGGRIDSGTLREHREDAVCGAIGRPPMGRPRPHPLGVSALFGAVRVGRSL
jgi:hypothetical protein